jgi:alanyl-tRNA synthetase
VAALKTKMATMSAAGVDDEVREINGVKVLAKQVPADGANALREAADQFRDRLKSGVVALGSEAGGKAMLIVVVTKDLTGKFHAGKIVKEIAAVVGGGGGGRPDMAQAGGSKPEKLAEALEKVYSIVEGA